MASISGESVDVSDKFKLSSVDVQRLLTDPSPDARADTAAKVASSFGRDLSPQERAMAEDIFRIMAQDAEDRVRAALSTHLKENPDVPRDVALKLADDVVQVAVPMLEYSTVLTDDDLISIVSKQEGDLQLAIAGRANVSPAVADAIVEQSSGPVVAKLMANEGAEISEPTFGKAIDRFSDDEEVNASIAHRPQIPMAVAERLVSIVSDKLRDHLVTHHELPADVASDLLLQSRERATVGLLDTSRNPMGALEMVEHLYENGRLTSTIILRALCVGDLDFFEASLAKLADIPVANAHMLVADEGEDALKRLYQKCSLPSKLYSFFRVAVDVAHETDYDGGPDDRERYRERMIERVLTHFEDSFDTESVDYLIAKLGAHENGLAA